MTISVAVRVDHLPAASVPATACSSAHSLLQPRTVLVPSLDHHGTVSSVKAFIRANLRVPDELQQLMAPLFTRLSEKDMVEDVYGRYPCSTDMELPDLHVDEDTLTFFGREGTRTVELVDDVRLDEYHILDRAPLQLKCLPRTLPELGGRIFVETKDGILPLLGVSPLTHVSELKQALENMTGIPMAQQLLSSVGRVMHDEFIIKDFDGFHTVFEDSVIDLCKSGDSNIDQGHRRMVIFISIAGEKDFTLVVQGRDLVQTVCLAVEARTGQLAWQQRVTFSGKVLLEKKTLGEYFVHPECTLQVTAMKTPHKLRAGGGSRNLEDVSGILTEEIAVPKPAARKVKLVRTSKGHVKGTLTIPVLTSDSVGDLKRKIRCTLQPTIERNASLSASAKDQFHIDVTPRSSPLPPSRAPSDSASENLKPVARNLFSPAPHAKKVQPPARSPPVRTPMSQASPLKPINQSVLTETVSPNYRSQSPADSPTADGQVPEQPSPSPAKMPTSLRKLQLKFGGTGSQNQSPKSGGLQWNSGLQRQNSRAGGGGLSQGQGPPSPRPSPQTQRPPSRSPAPPQSQCLSPKSPAPQRGTPARSTSGLAGSEPPSHAKLLAQSSSRDLMPELMSLPVVTREARDYSSASGDKTPGKLGAWFSEGIQAMKTLKEQVKVHLDR